MTLIHENHDINPQLVSTFIVICVSTYLFLTVIIPIGIIYYFLQRLYVTTSRQLNRLESVALSPIYSHFGESIQGAPTIRAFNLQKRYLLMCKIEKIKNERKKLIVFHHDADLLGSQKKKSTSIRNAMFHTLSLNVG